MSGAEERPLLHTTHGQVEAHVAIDDMPSSSASSQCSPKSFKLNTRQRVYAVVITASIGILTILAVSTGGNDEPVPGTSTSNSFSGATYAKGARKKQTGVDWPTLSTHMPVHVVVDVDTQVGSASSPYFFGANIPNYIEPELYLSNDTYTKMETAGVSFMRYPGGSVANKQIWDHDYASFPYFKQFEQMEQFSMDEFCKLIRDTGAEPLVQLNAAIAFVNGTEVAAEYYLKQHEAFLDQGVDVTYYEFGNENYGTWEPPYGDYDVDGELYADAFAVAAKKLKNKYPTIKMGIVGKYEDSSTDSAEHVMDVENTKQIEPGSGMSMAPGKDWMEDILSSTDCVKEIDFISIHEYFLDSSSERRLEGALNVPTDSELFDNLGILNDMAVGLQDLYTSYASDYDVPPVVMSEFNMAQTINSGCGALLQFINVMWHTEFIGEVIKGGNFAALNSFAWADVYTECSNTGRGDYGDYGMVSRGSDEKADGTPQAQFFSFALFDLAFGEYMVNATVMDGVGVKTYASIFSDGEIGLVIVNENPGSRKMRVSGLTDSNDVLANGWIMESNDADSTDPLWGDGLTWNGQTPLQYPLAQNYQPYTFNATKGEDVVFDVPAYSATGVVVYKHQL